MTGSATTALLAGRSAFVTGGARGIGLAVARAFVDARVHRIYGGTNEIMREIVARQVTGRK